MPKKSREEEILELQEKVFGKDGSKRRSYVIGTPDEMIREAREVEKNIEDIANANQSVNDSLMQQLNTLTEMTRMTAFGNDVNADIDRLQEEIKKDFGVQDTGFTLKQPEVILASNASFAGMEEELNEVVVSQKEAVHDTVIALRRPHVLQSSAKEVWNTFLMMGPKGSGKHTILTEAGRILEERQILQTGEVYWIDLSLYNTQEDEKLFLQDLYTAIRNPSRMIAFVNPETCFPAYLVMLASLFETGKVDLKKRYVMNKEQLVETNSSFAANTISKLEASAHYVALVTDLKKSKIIDLLGQDFIRNLSDIIETKALDEEAISVIVTRQQAELTDQSATKLNMKVTCDASCAEGYRKEYLPSEGGHSLRKTTDMLFHALTQYKLECNEDEMKSVTLLYDTEWKMTVGDKTQLVSDWLAKEETTDMESIKKELDEIVGLEDVKKYVLSLEDNYKIQKLREQKGLKTAVISKHMIFTGNPGTGKTTIARLISKYLRAIGVLTGGQLVEVTRADLVGRYVGHTAPLTMQVMKSALGGVLFIDEAYSLYRGKDDAFGLECIDTIVKGIEDYRDNLIVILAGYKQEMETFLTSNSGLKSRFPNVIDFKDYTAEELLLISKSIAKGKDYVITEECDAPLLAFFDKIQKDDSKISGNGRLARNKVEEAMLNQATRLLKNPDANMQELTMEDFNLDDSSFVE
ncbi:MAG: AAA family ATPase [Erysipelotrichaceae bacterium]|nr:AAA family ATPase [Erysipelotrichaceae bacterium]